MTAIPPFGRTVLNQPRLRTRRADQPVIIRHHAGHPRACLASGAGDSVVTIAAGVVGREVVSAPTLRPTLHCVVDGDREEHLDLADNHAVAEAVRRAPNGNFDGDSGTLRCMFVLRFFQEQNWPSIERAGYVEGDMNCRVPHSPGVKVRHRRDAC